MLFIISQALSKITFGDGVAQRIDKRTAHHHAQCIALNPPKTMAIHKKLKIQLHKMASPKTSKDRAIHGLDLERVSAVGRFVAVLSVLGCSSPSTRFRNIIRKVHQVHLKAILFFGRTYYETACAIINKPIWMGASNLMHPSFSPSLV